MTQQNSSVVNVRKCCTAESFAKINGYRNLVFLPGIGRFKGTWKNNLREGLSTLTKTNGIIYEGTWKIDKRHGHGLLQRKLHTERECEPIYDGQWKFDKRHGEGTAYYRNGCYEGEWKDDCREGLGIMWFHNGNYYIGEWKNNLFDGIGVHYDVHSCTLYEGYFRNGLKCGEGTLHHYGKHQIQKGMWIDGSCVTSILEDIVANENVSPLKSHIPQLCSLPPWVGRQNIRSEYKFLQK